MRPSVSALGVVARAVSRRFLPPMQIYLKKKQHLLGAGIYLNAGEHPPFLPPSYRPPISHQPLGSATWALKMEPGADHGVRSLHHLAGPHCPPESPFPWISSSLCPPLCLWFAHRAVCPPCRVRALLWAALPGVLCVSGVCLPGAPAAPGSSWPSPQAPTTCVTRRDHITAFGWHVPRANHIPALVAVSHSVVSDSL